MIKLNIFQKIKDCKLKGYSKSKVSQELNLHFKPVRKYWDMTDGQYRAYLADLASRDKVFGAGVIRSSWGRVLWELAIAQSRRFSSARND